jgi:hypothetical protein
LNNGFEQAWIINNETLEDLTGRPRFFWTFLSTLQP